MFRQLPKFLAKDKEQVLEEKLYSIERKLAGLPHSKHKITLCLDAIENCVSMIEQLGSKSKQVNILLVVIALVEPVLLRYPDREVRLADIRCIVHVMRITTPHDFYRREVLKEVFQLIEESFQGSRDMHNPFFVR